MAGRPRKAGARFPSGDIRNPSTNEPIRAVATWRRLREQVERGAVDPMWGSPLGKLAHFRRISATEEMAGTKWGQWCGRYERIMGFSPRSARSPQYDAGVRGSGHDLATINRSDEVFIEHFDRALEAARRAGGFLGTNVLDRVCVEGADVTDDFSVERLRVVLRALASHWGLTGT